VAGSAVEWVGDGIGLVLGVAFEVGALGQVLPDEAVGGAPPACGGVSLLPRSQGEWGWAKYTGILVAIVKDAWAAISTPWSWVMDPYRCTGRRLMALVSWIATRPGGSGRRESSGG
jgi:hypothetical protein